MKSRLILEFTEFNLQRLNPDSVQPAIHVNDPKLSNGAFDRHEDMIRQSMTKIQDITNSIKSTSSYSSLRSILSLDDQDLSSLKIIRISKSNVINYDVYITFVIGENEYWGVIKNIMSNPEISSEVFKDENLIQTKEWAVKIKGTILKYIKKWLKPQFGKFKLIENEINCYSNETGKLLKLPKNSIIEVLKSYDGRIIFLYDNDQYSLTGDNFIYFNWWFESVKENPIE